MRLQKVTIFSTIPPKLYQKAVEANNLDLVNKSSSVRDFLVCYCSITQGVSDLAWSRDEVICFCNFYIIKKNQWKL